MEKKPTTEERARVCTLWDNERPLLLEEFKERLKSDPDRYRQYIDGSWDLGDGEEE